MCNVRRVADVLAADIRLQLGWFRPPTMALIGNHYVRTRSALSGPVGGRKNDRAFTLIELLVVVAIVVVLIALLLPTLGKARRQSKSTICQSNLRAIGIGFSAYASEENDVIMPLGQSGPVSMGPPPVWNPYSPYWYIRCQRYFGSPLDFDIWNGNLPRPLLIRCPIALEELQIVTKFPVPGAPGVWDYSGEVLCYGLNKQIAPSYNQTGIDPLTGTFSQPWEFTTRRLRQYQSLKWNLVLVADGTLSWNGPPASSNPFYIPEPIHESALPWPLQTKVNSGTVYPVNYEGHNKGANILFTDFHVEWRGKQSIPGHTEFTDQ